MTHKGLTPEEYDALVQRIQAVEDELRAFAHIAYDAYGGEHASRMFSLLRRLQGWRWGLLESEQYKKGRSKAEA